jgi:hypothetical protein
MDKKTTSIWIAAEIGGVVAVFAIGALLDKKYYGIMALMVALFLFVFSVVMGLRSRR